MEEMVCLASNSTLRGSPCRTSSSVSHHIHSREQRAHKHTDACLPAPLLHSSGSRSECHHGLNFLHQLTIKTVLHGHVHRSNWSTQFILKTLPRWHYTVSCWLLKLTRKKKSMNDLPSAAQNFKYKGKKMTSQLSQDESKYIFIRSAILKFFTW